MKLQDLMNKLIAIHSEYGNLWVQGHWDGYWVSDLDISVDGDFLHLNFMPNEEEEKVIYGQDIDL